MEMLAPGSDVEALHDGNRFGLRRVRWACRWGGGRTCPARDVLRLGTYPRVLLWQGRPFHSYYANNAWVNGIPGGICERMVSSGGAVRGSGPHCSGYWDDGIDWCYTAPGGTSGQWQAQAAQFTAYNLVVSGNAYYGTLSPSDTSC